MVDFKLFVGSPCAYNPNEHASVIVNEPLFEHVVPNIRHRFTNDTCVFLYFWLSPFVHFFGIQAQGLYVPNHPTLYILVSRMPRYTS